MATPEKAGFNEGLKKIQQKMYALLHEARHPIAASVNRILELERREEKITLALVREDHLLLSFFLSDEKEIDMINHVFNEDWEHLSLHFMELEKISLDHQSHYIMHIYMDNVVRILCGKCKATTPLKDVIIKAIKTHLCMSPVAVMFLMLVHKHFCEDFSDYEERKIMHSTFKIRFPKADIKVDAFEYPN